jgi:hypothetical protein
VEDSDGVARAPEYQWVEIRGIGTQLTGLVGDDSTKAVALPFGFTWYGTNYTGLSVCTNGWISFGSNTMTSYDNTTLPTATFAAPTVFAVWDDQDARSTVTGSWIGYYNDAANGRFIVEYDSVVFYSTTTRLKYQVIYYDSTALHPYHDVVVQYNMLADRSSASVGFQRSGTVGCQELYNGTYNTTMLPLGNQRAVRITGYPEPLGVSGGPGVAAVLPQAYQLGLAYPNPARSQVTISYQLPAGSAVELAVYNITGQKVRTLVSGGMPAGYHTARWDGRDQTGKRVSAGVYLYRLTSPGYSRTNKLTILR